MFSRTLRSWGFARLPLVGVLMLGLCAAWVGPSNSGGTWGELLEPMGVETVVRVVWVEPASPGRWGRGVAEVIPEAIVEQSAEDRRDILLFDAVLDGHGEPFRVRRVGNLTRTPHADDRILVLDGEVLATAADVDGETVTLNVFDLRGDPLASVDLDGVPRGWGDRFKIAVTHAQIRGRAEGVGRRSYRLSVPRTALSGRLDDSFLTVQAGGQMGSVSLQSGEVVPGLYQNPLVLERQSDVIVLETWTQFAVNRFRAAPWFGPSRVASLEKYVFDHADGARGTWESLVGADNTALAEQVGPVSTGPVALPSEPEMTDAIPVGPASGWPPAEIVPPARRWGFHVVEGEGVWRPWVPEWGAGDMGIGRPWPIVRTAVRVNRRRQSDSVTLVAMDMRQLEVFLQAGSAHPKATTGFRGTGLIPRDASTLSRLVLGFNGGFKTSHGAYGMTLDRRVFVPVKPAMATIGFFEDGSVRMGTWPGRAPLGDYRREQEWQSRIARRGEAPEPPPDLLSLRQNLPPLVSGGTLNPGGARRWGGPVGTLSHTTIPRSGLCVAPPNTLVYVWAKRSSALDIGKGMILAGCTYGMHLDMNPYHTGMSMYHVPVPEGRVPPEIRGKGPEGTQVERAASQMSFDDRRYVAREVKDFFYVLRRLLLTDRLGPLPAGMTRWSARGLPVVSGAQSLAVVSRSDAGISLLAIDGSMRSDLPPVDGAVRVGFAQRIEGIPLVRDGRWTEPLPEMTSPIARGQTTSGDVVFAGCDGCGLADIKAVLAGVPLGRADVVARGSFQVDGHVDGQWRSVVGAPYPGEGDGGVTFVPAPLIAPIGTTAFTP